jgi:signal transduction histidine kinase
VLSSDPADVVTEAVDTFQSEASGSGVSVTAEIASGVPSVAFDGARILQVLCNLLSNALKFAPAQGSIVVRLHHVDDDVVCCVSDTDTSASSSTRSHSGSVDAACTLRLRMW